MIVVDTMVFAYALLGVEEYREEAAVVLETAGEIVVPDSMRAELANVVWQWCVHRDLPLTTGEAILEDANALISEAVPATHLWRRALEVSVLAGHPIYDTLFVAAAELRETRVVTFDRRLSALFPEIVSQPAAFLGH